MEHGWSAKSDIAQSSLSGERFADLDYNHRCGSDCHLLDGKLTHACLSSL